MIRPVALASQCSEALQQSTERGNVAAPYRWLSLEGFWWSFRSVGPRHHVD